MNGHLDGHEWIGEAELRMALRGLRQDIEPGRDLWPGIAARIEALPQQAAPAARARGRWLWPVSMAASMLLAAGLAWQMRPPAPEPPVRQAQAIAGVPSLVQREADAMTAQYRSALREFEIGTVHASWQPGLDTLDRSAAEIRAALRVNPDSRLLLEQLRQTYSRRLALSRRALYA